ncbi:MAG: NAD(P)(+) transhydrogenase (Re/Si-specific) subunit alpha, partial [Planctomycetota bacterium]
KRVAEADLVITTAQIPGRKAPELISEEMVRAMKTGSVIVDMAVESGGNCALSQPGKTIEEHGVTVIGPRNLPATVPVDASALYARNVLALMKPFLQKAEGEEKAALNLDREDDVVQGCLMTHEGVVCHERTKTLLEAESA